MLNTQGLESLVRRTPRSSETLSSEEWNEKVQARLAFLKPHLDVFNLQMLRQVPCLWGDTHFLPIANAEVTVTSPQGYGLDTRGLFHCDRRGTTFHGDVYRNGPFGEITSYPDSESWIWGVTRQTTWLIAQVTSRGDIGYKNRGREVPTAIHIWDSDLDEITTNARISYCDVWYALGNDGDWRARQTKLYTRALGAARRIEAEELAMSRIPSTK